MASYFTFKNAIPKTETCNNVPTSLLQKGSTEYNKCVYHTKINGPGGNRIYHPEKLLHGEDPALLVHILVCILIPYVLHPLQYYILTTLKSSFNIRNLLFLRLSQFIPILVFLFWFLYYFSVNETTFIINDHFILSFVCFLLACVKLDIFVKHLKNDSNLGKWLRRLSFLFLFEFLVLYHWNIICGFVLYFTGYPIINEYNNKVGGKFEVTCQQCWGHLIPSYALFLYGFIGFFIRDHKDQTYYRVFAFTSVFAIIFIATIWLGTILGYKNMFASTHFTIAFMTSVVGIILVFIYFIKKSIFSFFDFWVTLIFLSLVSYMLWMHAMMQSMKSTYLGVTHGVDAFLLTTASACFLGRNYSYYLNRLHYICVFMLGIWLALSCEQMGYTVNNGFQIMHKTKLFFIYSFYTILALVMVSLFIYISNLATQLLKKGKDQKYNVESNKEEIEPLIHEEQKI